MEYVQKLSGRQATSTALIVALIAVALLALLLTSSDGVLAEEVMVPVRADSAYESARKTALDWDPAAQFLEMSSVGKSSKKAETQELGNLEQVAWNFTFQSPNTGSLYRVETTGKEVIFTYEDPILSQLSGKNLSIALATERSYMLSDEEVLRALSFDHYKEMSLKAGLTVDDTWPYGLQYELLKNEVGTPILVVTAVNAGSNLARVVFDANTGEIAGAIHQQHSPYVGQQSKYSVRSAWVEGIE